jgi:SAM-dependent methyltransferase
VGVLANHLRADDRLLDVGAGAGRFSIPLAQRIREVLALEPSPSMSAALLADARAAGMSNITLVPSTWEEAPADLSADVAFSAHVVYSLPRIEEFLQFLERVARRWVAVALFGGPAQSRLQAIWKAVYGEDRLSNPGLPELLAVLWSLERYPDVTMLDVPAWPLGDAERARRALRRRLHVMPGTPADDRLQSAMQTFVVDWGDGQLGPLDRRPRKLVQVGGKEPGLMRRRDKMVHPYLTGMDDGHAETSESGVE